MNRENMTECMKDGCTMPQLWEINNYIDNLEQENRQLEEKFEENEMNEIKSSTKLFLTDKDFKQALIDIREYCNHNNEPLYTYDFDYDYEENMIDDYQSSSFREDILRIIDKVLGDEK